MIFKVFEVIIPVWVDHGNSSATIATSCAYLWHRERLYAREFRIISL